MLEPQEGAEQFESACIRCGLCARTNCGNFAPGTPNLGDIAASLLSGDETWRHFPFTCALCNRCTVYCPVGLKAKDLCRSLRGVILPKHPELRPNYRKFRTDKKYNLFSILKGFNDDTLPEITLSVGEATGDDYADHTAFFPGCSLFAYGPELVEKAAEWLREQRIANFTFTFCCGATFGDCGFTEEYMAYGARVRAYMAERGIKRLVVVCPHCACILPDTLEGSGIELLRLPELMRECGVQIPFEGKVSFHDACYDRDGGQFGTAARALFAHATMAPLEYEREETHCCGGGGMVSVYAQDYCEYRRLQRLGEIDAVDTDLLCSTCFSCVNSMQRSIGATPVKHYLELVFGIDIEWPEVYGAVQVVYTVPELLEYMERDEMMFE